MLECEISRERVPLRNAYLFPGQQAAVRVEAGVEQRLQVASAPFPLVLNKDPLFRVRGDIFANEVSSWHKQMMASCRHDQHLARDQLLCSSPGHQDAQS